MAAHQGHAVIVNQLCCMARVEVDALDNAGCTPLHHATALGHDGVVMELWSKSANVDLADANGWTGMWLDCSWPCAQLLLPLLALSSCSLCMVKVFVHCTWRCSQAHPTQIQTVTYAQDSEPVST